MGIPTNELVEEDRIYDFNDNGEIDIIDVDIFIDRLDGLGSQYDLDGNGEVNIVDTNVLLDEVNRYNSGNELQYLTFQSDDGGTTEPSPVDVTILGSSVSSTGPYLIGDSVIISVEVENATTENMGVSGTLVANGRRIASFDSGQDPDIDPIISETTTTLNISFPLDGDVSDFGLSSGEPGYSDVDLTVNLRFNALLSDTSTTRAAQPGSIRMANNFTGISDVRVEGLEEPLTHAEEFLVKFSVWNNTSSKLFPDINANIRANDSAMTMSSLNPTDTHAVPSNEIREFTMAGEQELDNIQLGFTETGPETREAEIIITGGVRQDFGADSPYEFQVDELVTTATIKNQIYTPTSLSNFSMSPSEATFNTGVTTSVDATNTTDSTKTVEVQFVTGEVNTGVPQITKDIPAGETATFEATWTPAEQGIDIVGTHQVRAVRGEGAEILSKNLSVVSSDTENPQFDPDNILLQSYAYNDTPTQVDGDSEVAATVRNSNSIAGEVNIAWFINDVRVADETINITAQGNPAVFSVPDLSQVISGTHPFTCRVYYGGNLVEESTGQTVTISDDSSDERDNNEDDDDDSEGRVGELVRNPAVLAIGGLTFGAIALSDSDNNAR